MQRSIGTLRYSRAEGKYWLVVDVDPEIVNFVRALLPPYIKLNKQKYSPHITVVRNEVPPNKDKWNLYNGEKIEFEYDPSVKNGTIYWWLNAYCDRLCEIREELGLTPHSDLTKPPNDESCFHITIGNNKPI
jgi:hypothetical protein